MWTDFRFVQIVPSDDGSYEIELTDLYPDTEYRYNTAVYIDTDCIFGEEKSFFTNEATEIAVLSMRTNPFENMYPDLTFAFENLPDMNSEYSFGVRITPSMEDVLWYAMYVKKSDLEGKDLTDDDIALMAFEEAYMNYDGDFSVQEVARAGAYDLSSSNFYSDSPDGFNALEKGVEYVAVAFAVNGDGDRISPVVMSEETFASNQ